MPTASRSPTRTRCASARLLLCLTLLLSSSNTVIDLKNPTLSDGHLTTSEGGVLSGPDIRIQAQCVNYTAPNVVASGNLMVLHGADLFVGDSIDYDFSTGIGTLQNGRAAIGPWYIRGAQIRFCGDGSIVIEEGHLTTCESNCPAWSLSAKAVRINDCGQVAASLVTVRVKDHPIFWLPTFQTNIRNICDIPLRARLHIGGQEGGRVGLRYRFLDRGPLTGFARLEYLFERGPAGGVELRYNNRFCSQNYFAHDRTVADRKDRFRFRVAGCYNELIPSAKWHVDLSYDWLSDEEMPSDYRTDDFNLRVAQRSHLTLHHLSNSYRAQLRTTPRLNTFQTINQRLPEVTASIRPIELAHTGILAEARTSAGYLNFTFARPTTAPGYESMRVGFDGRLYRPFHAGCFHLQPEAGLIAIGYSHDPENRTQALVLGRLGLRSSARFWRSYWGTIHQVEPYIDYCYTTKPTSRPIFDNFVFTPADAYVELNKLAFGLRQHLWKGCSEIVTLDSYALAFFNKTNIPGQIPWWITDLTWKPNQTFEVALLGNWNISNKVIDYTRLQLGITLSENIALKVEARHRSRYFWRKADRTNYTLNAFIPQSTLLTTQLSNHEETLLFHGFLRLNPTLSLELQTRHGWNRDIDGRMSRPYNEGRISFNALLPCRWVMRGYYEHREDDDRFALSFVLGTQKRPCTPGHIPTVW